MATASFLDYTVPGVPEVGVPDLHPVSTEKTEANPEGFKGAGESGTLPVPAAICSAVERAVRHLNPCAVVTRNPLTPERVVALIRPYDGLAGRRLRDFAPLLAGVGGG